MIIRRTQMKGERERGNKKKTIQFMKRIKIKRNHFICFIVAAQDSLNGFEFNSIRLIMDNTIYVHIKAVNFLNTIDFL